MPRSTPRNFVLRTNANLAGTRENFHLTGDISFVQLDPLLAILPLALDPSQSQSTLNPQGLGLDLDRIPDPTLSPGLSQSPSPDR
jgi:hypothetical protein